MKYSLRLVSHNKPELSSGICSSNQMIGWGLWDALSNYPHITLTYCDDSRVGGLIDDSDFTLVHSYAPFTTLSTLKEKTGHQVMWISELAYEGMDYNFTFLPSLAPNSEQLHLPILKDLVLNHVSNKLPGSILLDHNIPHNLDWHPFYANWSGTLFEWLDSVTHEVYQQRRVEWESPEDGKPPTWVSSLPVMAYPEYLKVISAFETFIMTHPGTYEHQIIDLVSRGTRVLVPVDSGRPFAPQDTMDRLRLETFSTREELLSLLNSPSTARPFSFDLCTPMSEVVSRINVHCQKVLRGQA